MRSSCWAAVFILPGIDDDKIDDAVVYGYAAGATIGHELTHGFDDEGRQFDEHGNLADWWTKEDAAEFVRRTAGIVEQFTPAPARCRPSGRCTITCATFISCRKNPT